MKECDTLEKDWHDTKFCRVVIPPGFTDNVRKGYDYTADQLAYKGLVVMYSAPSLDSYHCLKSVYGKKSQIMHVGSYDAEDQLKDVIAKIMKNIICDIDYFDLIETLARLEKKIYETGGSMGVNFIQIKQEPSIYHVAVSSHPGNIPESIMKEYVKTYEEILQKEKDDLEKLK